MTRLAIALAMPWWHRKAPAAKRATMPDVLSAPRAPRFDLAGNSRGKLRFMWRMVFHGKRIAHIAFLMDWFVGVTRQPFQPG
jgi:hypothetical protein